MLFFSPAALIYLPVNIYIIIYECSYFQNQRIRGSLLYIAIYRYMERLGPCGSSQDVRGDIVVQLLRCLRVPCDHYDAGRAPADVCGRPGCYHDVLEYIGTHPTIHGSVADQKIRGQKLIYRHTTKK